VPERTVRGGPFKGYGGRGGSVKAGETVEEEKHVVRPGPGAVMKRFPPFQEQIRDNLRQSSPADHPSPARFPCREGGICLSPRGPRYRPRTRRAERRTGKTGEALLPLVRSWYIDGMQTTIDKAGRVVIPAALRAQAGLLPGTELEIVLDAGSLRILKCVPGPKIVKRGKRLVSRATAPPKVRAKLDIARLVEEERSRWP
jgi:AbrB family looped-hinge helix DNA binding protein